MTTTANLIDNIRKVMAEFTENLIEQVEKMENQLNGKGDLKLLSRS